MNIFLPKSNESCRARAKTFSDQAFQTATTTDSRKQVASFLSPTVDRSSETYQHHATSVTSQTTNPSHFQAVRQSASQVAALGQQYALFAETFQIMQEHSSANNRDPFLFPPTSGNFNSPWQGLASPNFPPGLRSSPAIPPPYAGSTRKSKRNERTRRTNPGENARDVHFRRTMYFSKTSEPECCEKLGYMKTKTAIFQRKIPRKIATRTDRVIQRTRPLVGASSYKRMKARCPLQQLETPPQRH